MGRVAPKSTRSQSVRLSVSTVTPGLAEYEFLHNSRHKTFT